MDDDKARVLIVDDDPDLCALVSLHVRRWGFEAASTDSAAGLWRSLLKTTPDVVLLDVDLGETDGSVLVAEIRQELPDLPVIMVTRDHTAAAAVRSMKHGAVDYIQKPLDFQALRQAINAAVELSRVSKSLHAIKAGQERGSYHGLIGRSRPMLRLYQQIERVAPTDVTVLILGDTGTGKELVARTLHEASKRRQGPFVAVNAAAIPHELIESQLFGHEKGAFTGADRTHAGFCEQADGGTLFLDEIGEMRVDVQAKLLRFLQDLVVQRVGAQRSRRVDARVVAATNVDPEAQIKAGRLREDLFYRLRVVTLQLAPLRERQGDIGLLTAHFLARATQRHGRCFEGLASEALAALERHVWPGNIRELEHTIEAAVVMNDGRELTVGMLPPGIGSSAPEDDAIDPVAVDLGEAERAEMERLAAALAKAEGVPAAAAERLGMSRATIYRKLKKYGLRARS